MIVDPSQPVEYSTKITPSSYVCGTCGAKGCKLWREYQTFLENQRLHCCDCAAEDQGKDISSMTEDGRRSADIGDHGRKTDQIGWLIPAVPTEANDTFWGYSAVPEPGVQWWRNLPLRQAA
jgi:hypothetical protein